MKSSQFRTEVKLKKGEFPILSYDSSILLIGSCFSDNIADKLNYYKLNNRSNPFGVTYNPASIYNQMKRIANKQAFDKKDLIIKGEFYNSFELHGSFDEINEDVLLEKANEIMEEMHAFLTKATHFYITLGTAWVYIVSDKNEIANNCHKYPASHFTKKMLSVNEIIDYCNGIMKESRLINPNLKFIFTLSPVRHLKDGFTENSLSKSNLRSAIGQVISDADASYFPSFEIMMDDLRDYRFYKDDLLHPNEMAIQYIWEKMLESQFAEEEIYTLQEVEKIQNAIRHKSFSPQSDSNKDFIRKTLERIKLLQDKCPKINFSKERDRLQERLTE